MNSWMQQHPATVLGLVLWAIGLLWLMPGRKSGASRTPRTGVLIAVAGLLSFFAGCGKSNSDLASEVMFWVFATGALGGGVLMISSRNPVYGALWFAIATLCTCGLFMLQSAPFLAAATIIVYAGAVIVTFLFVIMLAQQSGAAGYDQRSQQVWPASLGAFVFLGSMAMVLQSDPPRYERVEIVAAETPVEQPGTMVALDPTKPVIAPQPPAIPNFLSRADSKAPVGSMKGLGRSLFGDYLFAVELAGTLLLVASIGAIAIAPRREEGAL